jgi:MerR-like DNA binding protein
VRLQDASTAAFTPASVAKLAGLSLRQLQRWTNCGVIVVGRNGRTRCYSSDDLLLILVLSELRRKKLSFQKVRSIAPKVAAYLVGLGGVPPARRPRLFVLTDGRKVWMADSNDKTCEYVANVLAPLACVDVRKCLETIDRKRDNENQKSACEA